MTSKLTLEDYLQNVSWNNLSRVSMTVWRTWEILHLIVRNTYHCTWKEIKCDKKIASSFFGYIIWEYTIYWSVSQRFLFLYLNLQFTIFVLIVISIREDLRKCLTYVFMIGYERTCKETSKSNSIVLFDYSLNVYQQSVVKFTIWLET